MNKEEMKLLSEMNSYVHKSIEYFELKIYSLVQLLMDKGIINNDDYQNYLSEEALNDLLTKINEELGDMND